MEDVQQHLLQRQQQQLAENLAIQQMETQNFRTIDNIQNFAMHQAGSRLTPVNVPGQSHHQLMHNPHIDYHRAQMGMGGMHVTALCFSIRLRHAKQQFDESVFTIHADIRRTT
jgi:hypothetical protein